MSEDPSQTPPAGLLATPSNNKNRAKRKSEVVSSHDEKKSLDILSIERARSANNLKMLKHLETNLDIKALNDSQTHIFDVKNERISPNNNENPSIFSP